MKSEIKDNYPANQNVSNLHEKRLTYALKETLDNNAKSNN